MYTSCRTQSLFNMRLRRAFFFHVLSAPLVFGAPKWDRPRRTRKCTTDSQYISNGTADDSPAIQQASAECSRDAVVVFKEGANYNVFCPLSAKNVRNVEIQMNGNLHLLQNITTSQAVVNQFNALTSSASLSCFSLAGPQTDYTGTDNVSNGWIYSHGQALVGLQSNQLKVHDGCRLPT